MPDDKNQPMGWRGGKKPARQAKYGWKPAAQGPNTSWWMRRTTQFSLLIGIFMCVAVVVALFLILRGQDAATIILVGANPADDALNLLAPQDMHGWQGGLKLARWIDSQPENKKDSWFDWGRKNLKAETDTDRNRGKPFSLSNENLPKVIELMQNAKGVVVVYFGMLGMTQDGEPKLYGANGELISVRTILEKIKPIASTRTDKNSIVLLFDAGRLAYHAESGVMHNDFMRSLHEKLTPLIKEIPHCTLICSSSPGETAWNSDEFGSSVFLAHVLDALQGKTKNVDNANNVTLERFFKYVEKQTNEWTKKRFVSWQTPIILTGKDVDTSKVILVQHVDTPDNQELKTSRPSKSAFDDLNDYHRKAEQLARQVPGPEVYTPLHWQRFRALTQRLQNSLRLSDQDTKVDSSCGETVQRIKTHLDTLHAEMVKSSSMEMKRARETSLVWKTLFEAKPADREISAETILANAAQLNAPPANVEEHLAWMLTQFWKGQTITDPQKQGWKQAVETRYLAERATLAASSFAGHLYSERLWPLISATIQKADEKRRLGEDMLFTQGFADAQDPLLKAREFYQQLLQKIPRYQQALTFYHRAISEATCLTQWHLAWIADSAVSYSDKEEGMKTLWRDIHELNRQIREIKSIDAAETQWASVEKLGSSIQNQLKQQYQLFTQATRGLQIQQKGRYQRELLLSFPWPLGAEGATHEVRKLLFDEMSDLSQKLHGADATEFKPVKTENSINEIVRQRFSMQFARLGDIDPSARDHFRLLELLPRSGEWEKKADELSSKLAFEYLQLSTDGSKQPKRPGTSLSPDQLDEYSRFTLSFLPLERQEPAQFNRQRMWTDLLHDQARRTCLDHWYDNKKNPYFEITAQKFISDAPDTKRAVAEDIKSMMITSKTLMLPGTQEIIWTSELERDWAVEVRNQLPQAVTGQASIWADEVKDPTNAQADSAIRVDQGAIRLGIPLGETTRRSLILKATDSKSLDQKNLQVMFKPRLFFRGLELDSELIVKVQRQPQLIVTQSQPENGATFSVCSDKDLKIGLGHLAIVMDYSGSMGWDRDKNDPSAIANSRRNQAVKGLRELLKNLPSGVSISIRVFSDEVSSKGVTATEDIRSWLYCKGTIAHQGNDVLFSGQINQRTTTPMHDKMVDQKDRSIEDLTQYLMNLAPYNQTPLIKSMEECLEYDIRKSELPADDVTMLVLTDGADSSRGLLSDLIKEKNTEKIDQIVKANSDRIKNSFGKAKACVRIIFFNDSSNEEWVHTKAQFMCIKEFTSNPGDILRAEDLAELIKTLNESLRPKIQLYEKNGSIVQIGNRDYFPAPRVDALKFADATIYPDPRKLKPGDYESSVWAGRKQPITFFPGDHLFMKLLNDEGNKVKYSRELFFHIWKRYVNEEKQFRQAGNWHLTLAEVKKNIPESDSGSTRRHVTATLENSLKQTVNSSDTLKQHRPGLVWWDVKAIDPTTDKEAPAAGTVHISNRGYYLAPAWAIDQCPQDEKELQLYAWVSDNSPEISETLKFKVGMLNPKKPYVARMGAMTVSIALEKHCLINACVTRTATEVNCLVLRVQHEAGRKYLFQAQGTLGKRIDHHYYDQAKSTTVYFSPLPEAFEQDKEQEITLEAIDISKWMQQRQPTLGIRVPADREWIGPQLPVRQNADGTR